MKGHPNAPDSLRLWLYDLLRDSRRDCYYLKILFAACKRFWATCPYGTYELACSHLSQHFFHNVRNLAAVGFGFFLCGAFDHNAAHVLGAGVAHKHATFVA